MFLIPTCWVFNSDFKHTSTYLKTGKQTPIDRIIFKRLFIVFLLFWLSLCYQKTTKRDTQSVTCCIKVYSTYFNKVRFVMNAHIVLHYLFYIHNFLHLSLLLYFVSQNFIKLSPCLNYGEKWTNPQLLNFYQKEYKYPGSRW